MHYLKEIIKDFLATEDISEISSNKVEKLLKTKEGILFKVRFKSLVKNLKIDLNKVFSFKEMKVINIIKE